MILVGNLWYELILVYSSVGFFFFFFLLTDDFTDYVESKVRFSIKIGKYPKLRARDAGKVVVAVRALAATFWLPFTLYLMFKSGSDD